MLVLGPGETVVAEYFGNFGNSIGPSGHHNLVNF